MRDYLALTKPGIIRGNVLTAAGGVFLGSALLYDWSVITGVLVGLSLVIASACVVNNIIDKDIDARMERTKQRATSNGSISIRSAGVFAALLLVGGTAVLVKYTNWLTVGLALFGFFAYVVLYGYAKRKGDYGTLVGSISGAVPIVTGYAAATGRIDSVSVLLGICMIAWQMPHFYAISLYRKKDYKAAGIPVLSITRGDAVARQQIILYITLFTGACFILGISQATGFVFLIVMTFLNLRWLRQAHKFDGDYDKWARGIFVTSLFIISMFSSLLIINKYLY